MIILATGSVTLAVFYNDTNTLTRYLISNPVTVEKTRDFFVTFNMFINLALSVFVPVVFLYSVVSERMQKTDFQTFTLPVTRLRLIISKCFLLLFAGFFMIVIPGVVIDTLRLNGSFMNSFTEKISLLVMILGVSAMVTGIISTVRENRFLLGTGLLIAIVILINKTIPTVSGALRFYYIDNYFHKEMNPFLKDVIYNLLYTSPNIYMLCMGAIFLTAGIALYAKFEEI